MRMMKTLWPLGAAALALGLSGCGGGSNTQPAATTAATTPATSAAPAVVAPPGPGTPIPGAGTLAGANSLAVALRLHTATPGTVDDPAGLPADYFGGVDQDPVFTRTSGDAMLTTAPTLRFRKVDPPAAIEGWAGLQYMMDGNVNDETIVVYTNIKPGKDATFSAFYTTQGRLGVTGTFTDGSVNLALTALTAASKAGLYGSGVFPSGPVQTYSYEDKDSTTTVDERKRAGTFNGVPGVYACTDQDGCTAETDASGNLVTLTGAWTFTPTKATSMIAGALTQEDYLHFGYWLKTTYGSDGATFDVETFYGAGAGMAEYEASADSDTIPAGVSGTAEYVGPAAGVYMRAETFTEDNGVDSATTGAFTAVANLAATFDSTTIANNKIGGTVSNFMDDNGRSLGWTVMLTDNKFANANNVSTGVTQGHEDAARGAWTAQFYGPITPLVDHDSNPGTANVAPMPAAVAGEFNAHFNNGVAVGAFATTRQ